MKISYVNIIGAWVGPMTSLHISQARPIFFNYLVKGMWKIPIYASLLPLLIFLFFLKYQFIKYITFIRINTEVMMQFSCVYVEVNFQE